jgi:outer membrane immunogenic protein
MVFEWGSLQVNRALARTAAIFGIVVAAGPSLADEAPIQPRPTAVRVIEGASVQRSSPNRQSSWTGAQIGGQGGISSMAQGFAEPGAHLFPDCTIFPASYCQETPFSFTGHSNTITGGLFLGYRFQFGGMVVGIEGDTSYKNGSNSMSLYDANTFRQELFTGSVKQGWDGSVRGRAGFLVTPWILVYGTGGVAAGRIEGSFSYAASDLMGAGASVTGSSDWSDVRTGLTAGGGVETNFAPGMTARLEYRYTDFGSYSREVPLTTVCAAVCTSQSSNAVINLHPAFHTLRIGLAFNF